MLTKRLFWPQGFMAAQSVGWNRNWAHLPPSCPHSSPPRKIAAGQESKALACHCVASFVRASLSHPPHRRVFFHCLSPPPPSRFHDGLALILSQSFQASALLRPPLIGCSFYPCSLKLTLPTKQNTGVSFLTGSNGVRGCARQSREQHADIMRWSRLPKHSRAQ